MAELTLVGQRIDRKFLGPKSQTLRERATMTNAPKSTESRQTITLGAGCFWCVEAIFEQYDGVEKVASGYMGGTTPNPTYQQVCSGDTGHAEVIQVQFDATKISLPQILNVFWQAHDPTTLNRQGNDVGTQYRSAIFYENEEQRQIAEDSKANVASSFQKPIVTEIKPATEFYPAEDYHQEYYRLNKTQPYCQLVIRPKLDKLGLKS